MIGNREITDRGRERYLQKYQADYHLLPEKTRSLIETIDKLNKASRVGFRRRNLSALLSKYFFDMKEVLRQQYTLLKKRGMVFIVVGNNRTVAGGEPIEIRTAEHLNAIAELVGFRLAS